jgi:hypothetical protein
MLWRKKIQAGHTGPTALQYEVLRCSFCKKDQN